MAYIGFVGDGFVGNFPSTSALEAAYPAQRYAGRKASVETAGVVAWYFSTGAAWAALGAVYAPYLGQVSLRSKLMNRKPATTTKQIRGKKGESNVEAVTSLTLVFANWFVSGAANSSPTYQEANAGGTATFNAAIEYPAGVFTQVKFGGNATGNAADGVTLVSDATAVSIPANTKYWIHYFQQQTSTGFIVYEASAGDPGPAMNSALWGDQCDAAASGLTDITMTGVGYTNSLAGSAAGPILVLANMTKPSMLLLGNSIDWGQNGAVDALGVEGISHRSFATGNLMGIGNAGIQGDSWQNFVANSTKRISLAQYFTHATFGGVTNDAAASRTSAQMLADLQTAYAQFPTLKKYQLTTLPYGSGASGTTVAANNAARVNVNTTQKGGVANILGTFDVASVLESPTVTGTWQFPGDYDTAGTHPTQQGYIRVATSGVINPGLINRS